MSSICNQPDITFETTEAPVFAALLPKKSDEFGTRASEKLAIKHLEKLPLSTQNVSIVTKQLTICSSFFKNMLTSPWSPDIIKSGSREYLDEVKPNGQPPHLRCGTRKSNI